MRDTATTNTAEGKMTNLQYVLVMSACDQWRFFAGSNQVVLG